MTNSAGKSFGLGRFRVGQTGLSASKENRKADLLTQLANLRVLTPLFMRRNGSGIEIGITEAAVPAAVAYACRVDAVWINNEPASAAQMTAPHDPTTVTYTVRPDARSTGPVPPGVDFTLRMPVRYGRPFGDTAVRIIPAAVGDLCFVSSAGGAAELWIISERCSARACTPAAPPPDPDPAPSPELLTASANSPVRFGNATDTALITPPIETPDPQMATHATSPVYHVDAAATNATSETFYVGDADFVTLTANMQAASAVKSSWGRSLNIEWSPDGRSWKQGAMIDAVAKTYSLAALDKDGFAQLDVREGIAYVRAVWASGGTPLAAGTLLEIKWAKKRGTSR